MPARVVLDALVGAAVGAGIGLSLAAPPGPVNAIIASHTVGRSWRAGFFVGAGAMTADSIFLGITVLAYSLIVAAMPAVFPFLGFAGAAVMAYFAWTTIRSWNRAGGIPGSAPEAHARSYATGLAVNITSPYPILWWLTAGLALINELGAAVLVGFYAGLLFWITAFPLALREAQRRFVRTYHAVLLFSVVLLAAFAAWLAASAALALM